MPINIHRQASRLAYSLAQTYCADENKAGKGVCFRGLLTSFHKTRVTRKREPQCSKKGHFFLPAYWSEINHAWNP